MESDFGMSAHRDPTFEAVARLQARDCTGCRNHKRLWGLEFCEQEKWTGAKNMKRCNDYRRVPERGGRMKYHSWQCQKCGANIGWLGRLMAWLPWGHRCIGRERTEG